MSVVQAAAQHDDIEGLTAPAQTRAIVGHEAQRQALDEALRSGRLHHAWAFQGPRGIGKASVAFAFARKLLSGAPGAQWDGQGIHPDLLRQIAQGGHPNLLHITRPAGDRGGFRTQITVEEIRRLNHFFHTTTASGWRVAIVDPAEDMNRNAANALLKILEEPPERSIFLIVNHMSGRLLPTLRSRCRVLRFEELAPEQVATVLQREGNEASGQAVQKAAERSGGSVRGAAMMLLAGALEVADEVERLYAMERPDWTGLQKLLDALTLKGREAAFEAMCEEVFRLLGKEADEAATRGNMGLAARLAALWQDEQKRWREAAAFNLDRKQMVLSFFRVLQSARRHDAKAA